MSMTTCAASHPGMLVEPAPVALFLAFCYHALNFELRAWTSRFPLPQHDVRLRQG